MMMHWRMPRAFPTDGHFVPLWIHVLDATLLVKKSVIGYGLLLFGAARMAAVVAI